MKQSHITVYHTNSKGVRTNITDECVIDVRNSTCTPPKGLAEGNITIEYPGGSERIVHIDKNKVYHSGEAAQLSEYERVMTMNRLAYGIARALDDMYKPAPEHVGVNVR